MNELGNELLGVVSNELVGVIYELVGVVSYGLGVSYEL